MTIELTSEQEQRVRDFVKRGYYESVEDFIDDAITTTYARTEAFNALAREKLAASQEDIEAGRVVTVGKGQIGSVLDKLRKNELEFDQ